jgi:quercetin dioxygenase-like cupin family protein
LNPYALWIQDLPQVDTPFDGMDGRMISGPDGQAVFFRAAERVEVPAHAHGAQWGVVVTGLLHLTVEGEGNTYEPGETYDIPDGAQHSAILEAGTCVIDVFRDPDRYSPKG